MLTIYDDVSLAAARGAIADADLTAMVDRIAHDAKASDLWAELTCILIVAPNDSGEDIESVLGFGPIKTGVAGSR